MTREIVRDFLQIDGQHYLISGDLTIRELFDQLDLPFSNLKATTPPAAAGL